MSTYTDRGVGIGSSSDTKKKDSFTQVKIIDVTIGVFFDGTLNNKYNIDYGKDIDDSYIGTYTNVAELYEGYTKSKNIYKVYIEGIGTACPIEDPTSKKLVSSGLSIIDDDTRKLLSSGAKDDLISTAFGTNLSVEPYLGILGISVIVRKTLKIPAQKHKEVEESLERKRFRAWELITKELEDNPPTSDQKFGIITLDVFGFSRGAATARSFVNYIKEYKEYTKYSKVTFVIRFMGLFDTVSSHGIGYGDDVGKLQLRIEPKKVQKVVHLVAADEFRESFALTSIDSAGSEKGITINMPGSHSDIGGGYKELERELLWKKLTWLDKNVLEPFNFYGHPRCLELSDLIHGKWISTNAILTGDGKGGDGTTGRRRYDPEEARKSDINKSSEHTYVKSYIEKFAMLERYVYNKYAKIPLALMYEFAKVYGIYFDESFTNKTLFCPYCQDKEMQSERCSHYLSDKKDNLNIDTGNLIALKTQFIKTHITKEIQIIPGNEYQGNIDGIHDNKELEMKYSIDINRSNLNLIKKIRARYIHLSAHWEGLVNAHQPNGSADFNGNYKRHIYGG